MKKIFFIALCLFVGFTSFSSVSNDSRAVNSEGIAIPGDVAMNNHDEPAEEEYWDEYAYEIDIIIIIRQ